MPDKDELDLLLDSALATYADPGPDSGIEGRVLASLEAAREVGELRGLRTSTWRWLRWIIAVPMAASVLLWVAVNKIQHVPSRQIEQAQGTAIHAPMTTTRADANGEKHPPATEAKQAGTQRSARLKPCRFKSGDEGPCRSGTREVAKIGPLPKLDVFPTPRPLTTEEKVLVTVAHDGSKPERDALVAAAAQSDAPLSIAALDIPPLTAPSEGKN